ncbi:MAG: DeoR/GlpR transcriptional regulator [Oscillospiraceae bacterium]|nr:DeoR/GlpR transcriptional regulator [Oscillospiraceae bacterium]MBQ8731850.1 DeoR/GlpR transcriptional regulator [Oscillospiraceae bacterium]
MNSVRRERLKKYIAEKGIVSLKELTTIFSDVSLMTIHRDLDFLEEDGKIIRMRGGARYIGEISAHEPSFEIREVENRKAKEQIAEKAVRFIHSGSSVFFDAGTTTMALARLIPDDSFSVITSAPNIALEVARRTNPTVSMCGGTLNRSNMTLSGTSAMEMLEKVNIDVAFLVCTGFSLEGGFTCGKESEADVKNLIIKKARTVIMLMDRSKLNKMLPFTFCGLKDINYMICEGELPPKVAEAAAKAGVQLL